jgi:hypothetical protein
MTPEEKEQMDALWRQIQIEKDQQKFNQLVHELNELLARKDNRPGPPQQNQPA